MSSESHALLLERAQRALGSATLVWLRRARIETSWQRPLHALLSEEGEERWEQALHDREYTGEELDHAARVLAQLGRQRILFAARPELAELQHTPLLYGASSERPDALLLGLLRLPLVPREGSDAARALVLQLDAHALRFVELRGEADRAGLAVAKRSAPAPLPVDSELEAMLAMALPVSGTRGRTDPGVLRGESALPLTAAGGAASFTLPDTLLRAKRWLSDTDDAARDMTGWLLRDAGATGKGWLDLLLALRALRFNGLARPADRMLRLSLVARRLGFERIMSSRMRVERAVTLLGPRAAVVALDVPSDVRIAAPSVEYGLLSDLAVSEAIGCGLGLALAASASKPCLRWPLPTHMAHAMGALFLQLRADRDHLVRVAGFDRDAAEHAARHAAIVVLLRVRLAAAFACVDPTAHSDRERLSLVGDAAQRALGCSLPEGLAALLWLSSAPDAAEFTAYDCGLALHAALRERFDEDFYVNPRVSEVLHGVGARGHLLDEPSLRQELGADSTLGPARALELLG